MDDGSLLIHDLLVVEAPACLKLTLVIILDTILHMRPLQVHRRSLGKALLKIGFIFWRL